MKRGFLVIIALLACLPGLAIACLWDSETLAMQRYRFPGVLETITGKFLRHGPEFYRWRIADRLGKIQMAPDSQLYDDLAVAYEKIGDHRQAIDTMLKKEQAYPNQYTTEANLGTFLIHDGDLKAGLKHIWRAIEMNPNAHFGREIYQARLVEYILARQHEGVTVLPLGTAGDPNQRENFAAFLRRTSTAADHPKLPEQTSAAAMEGVLGMMRFGQYDSPVLLEVLGDLLADGKSTSESPGEMLAARAYLRAAQVVPDKNAQAAYRELASQVLAAHKDKKPPSIRLKEAEGTLKGQLKDAERWFSTLTADEHGWIQTGKNPEREFAAKYLEEPKAKGPISTRSRSRHSGAGVF